MESGNSSRFGANVQLGTRSLPLEIDLNETPLPSPREALAGDCSFPAEETTDGGSSGEVRCGSCGRVLHVNFLGAGEGGQQGERKCLECASRNGGERLRSGGVGLLDMNASPPGEPDGEDDDEDGVLFLGESFGRQALEQDRERNGGKMQVVHNTCFVGHSFNAPVTYSNLLYSENGYNFHTASRSVTSIVKSGLEVPLQQRLTFESSSRETDLSSTLQGKLWGTHYTPPKYVPQSASDVYLQALREYIFERKGVLGDGWQVKFDYCQSRCKTLVVYCAPDGSRFESMTDVARYLHLLPNSLSLETEDRGNGYALAHRESHSNQRGKETSRSLRANSYKEVENNPRSKGFRIHYPHNDAPVPPGFEMVIQARKYGNSRSAVELDRVEDGDFGSQHFNDGFPVQFEDFRILSVGKIDPRPSYHNASQIWPVAYRSSWHDKITGSLFVCEVSDGGDGGPVFKVRRCPCTTQSIPEGSTILSRPIVGSFDGDKLAKDDSAIFGIVDDDENTDIQMLLEENILPNIDDDILSCLRKRATENFDFQKVQSDCRPQELGRGDIIGEFEVEGRSPFLVWEMVSQTLLHACHEAYQQKGALQFFCKHDMEGRDVIAIDTIGSLSKFCYLAGPTNIPRLIQSVSEFDACCKMLVEWLQQDRFGLDVEFVQELIEQLPGVNSCSEYIFLSRRGHFSTLQTVGSGFLLAKRKSDVRGEKGLNNFLRSCRRPRKESCPLGKTLSSKLPAYLIGDALQAWEFSQRFSEVLGMEKHFSFQKLECEFINPWLDNLDPLGKPANKHHCALVTTEAESNRVAHPKLAFPTQSRCTGAILTKAHSSLLKVVIGELLSKVTANVDPSSDAGEGKSKRGKKKDLENSVTFDAGECKSKRGKKKDVENLVTAKKIKLDMLTVNELTWPELARRYILAVLSMEGNLESAEIICRERRKVFQCLQGDGGPLCGSPTGVVAMEADALLLAEASKRVFGSLKSKNDIYNIDIKESDCDGASENSKVSESEIPEWAEVLEPVRKLPTNVGARIRKCVYEALRRNPPEWAKDKLEHSISKEVYKGNASGPTKRAVVEVLGRVRRESPQVKPEKKEKGKDASTISDLVVKQCRIVLRKTAAEDDERVFCNLLGKTLLTPGDNDDDGLIGYPGMVARPLDFRTIDIRLAAGTYGVSHEAFLEDVREVWHNIRTAYGNKSDWIDLAETLSLKFEDLYENEVLALVQKIEESGYPNCPTEEAKKDIDDMLMHASESMLPRAPWDDGVCKVCGMDKDDDSVLLCDVCDSEYHTYCLNPPLARIPEGNWYCPSCVAAKVTYRNARGTQLVNRCKKKICRGELVDNILEGLTKLAQSMELKEYWEFTVEERIFLLKFLCEEALSSAIIRDHLDQCAALSSELQPKLRTLNSERKNLTFREEVMAANMVKGRINICNGEGETGSEALASVLSNDAKFVGPKESNQDGCNGSPLPANQVTADHISFDPNKAENIPSVYADVSQAYKIEASSPNDEISCLNDKIATLESELFKVQVRKEFLGRDSAGRPYWVVDGPGFGPQVVVNGSVTANDGKGKEPADPNITNPGSWSCYESDTEIGGLVEWLSDDDFRERELRESILQWQRNKSKGSKDAAEKDSLSSSNDGKASEAGFLVTKALTALEKKFGPFYSCECLEPLWPSRQHCLTCHQTFSSSEDLERHSHVNCSTFSPSHFNSEVNEGSSKGKRTRMETPIENGPDDVKAMKNEKRENRSGFDKFQNDPECPFDFEEIKAKFVIHSSLKELVKDIGLIGTNGTPSFVPSIPPYLSDPALSLVPTVKNEVNPSNESTDLKDQQQQSRTRANVVSTDNILNSSSKCFENVTDEEASRAERARPKSTSGKDQFSSIKNKIAVLSSGKLRVIRESSLKPLVGKVSEILRLLKKNLLDMDAALPEDALRPLRVNQEKRCAWRAFVKSAASIYEMSQATILLEDMIKTEYLKSAWWYWSTPSAAANISTLSALSLRIYTLDAAIIYEKLSSNAGPKEIPKPSCKPDKGSHRGNNVKSSGSPVMKDSDCEAAENSKNFKSRSSKRRKDSGG